MPKTARNGIVEQEENKLASEEESVKKQSKSEDGESETSDIYLVTERKNRAGSEEKKPLDRSKTA